MSSALDDSSKGITFFQWMILGTLTLTSTLYAMSMTIANIALPQLQGALGATQDQIAWTVTFNIVGTAIVTPMTGWLTLRFGQRRLMLGTIFGFAISSSLEVSREPIYLLSRWAFFSHLEKDICSRGTVLI